jgi:hypothetical protein
VTDWLRVDNFCFLDSAICNHKIRKAFLQSSGLNVNISGVAFRNNVPSLNFLDWILSKNVNIF